MGSRKIKLACFRYEHTDALFDGSIKLEGVDAEVELKTAGLVTDIFRPMVEGAYDIAEFGLTYLLRTLDQEPAPFLALPIFPARNFRHSAIFVHTASGIRTPKDLAGKTVGEFALYGHDAGIWPKGILSDEYGVTVDQCSWVIGGTNFPLPSFDWIPQPMPKGVTVRHAARGETLGGMLQRGELDALISVDVPRAILDGSPGVARLFPDYVAAERDYFRRTGIFPPMHVLAVRRELASEPELLRAVYDAFVRAKDQRARWYLDGAAKQHMAVMTPWFSQLFADNRALMSDDWWPYGLAANRKAVDTFLRYYHEQGLSPRRLAVEDLFVPSLWET